MSIQIRPVTSSDKTAWNTYVAQHPQATPYHNFAWVQSVEHAYGHPNVSLIALDKEKVVGILPIIKMHIPFSGVILCSLPYCDLGHLLADNESVSFALLEQLKKLKTSTGAKAIVYRDTALLTDENIDTENLIGKKVRMLLALPESSEQLLKGFKSKLRSQINKAEKNGLTYKIGNQSELLDDFYTVFVRNMRKLGSPVHGKNWFTSVRENYRDNLIISVVYTETTPIGAGIVLLNATKACIPWASTLSEFNRLAPNMMLYWSLLQNVTDANVKIFDFGRSTYDEGTFKFKQQWGARPVPLCWNIPGQENTSPETPASQSSIRTFIEQTWSRMPLAMTTLIGPHIRKYISL